MSKNDKDLFPEAETMGDILLLLVETMVKAERDLESSQSLIELDLPKHMQSLLLDKVARDFFLLHLGALCFKRGYFSQDAMLESFFRDAKKFPNWKANEEKIGRSARNIERVIREHGGCWDKLEAELIGKPYKWTPPQKGEGQ